MKFLVVPILMGMALLAGVAQAGPEDIIRAKLKTAMPEAQIISIRPTPAGLYQVNAKGYESVFVTADGRYLFQGDLLEIQGDRIVNLEDAGKADESKAALAALSPADSVNFPAVGGKPKAIIHVFTDVDCGYCRKLHAEIAQINKLGIEVRYLAFPRAGESTPTSRKLDNVWCSSDRQSAMTLSKQGKSLPEAPKVCKSPVNKQYELGVVLGVRGTPAIFAPDGKQVGGYLAPASLAKALGIR
ncbi:MAG: DsbC family protein [Moraxellaceae bacterium]|jgi:thiol:disulfide interchange protein DsbC|nr:DsbC family protein [Moraxellaceae bacterium]MBP7228929.1 DsbC family protein [Moraxellaceae bacterium]MBP9045084.1 DsbC family protein [Moraxellaceae bacterium]MBP9729926.1 DsbC family protein [Moraxellaceae bacterium]HQV40751.1 DsbC family protein [Moraxellaceae bacterium]